MGISLSALVLSVWSIPAGASDVPKSAYSGALGIDPAFLDHSTQVFVHPARLIDVESGVGGFSLSDQSSLVAKRSLGSGAIGLQSQSGDVLGLIYAMGSERYRVGATFRSRYRKTESTSGESESSSSSGYFEPRFGISRLTEDSQLDLTFAARFPQNKSEWPGLGHQNTLEQTDPVQPEVSLRFNRALSEVSSVQMVGGFASRIVEWVTNDDRGVYPGLGERYGHKWFVGAAWRTQTKDLEELYVSVDYEQVRPSAYENDAARGFVTHSEAVGLAVSGVADLFVQNLRGLVGLRWNYSENIILRSRVVDGDLNRTEELGGEFTWGLDYQWKNLSVTGAMKTDLQLGSPFLSVDAGVSL
jgi:hypothetical protein